MTDAAGVARVAAGHDAAISAVFDPAAATSAFYADAHHALLGGLSRAGVARLLVVGLASVLQTEHGTALMDTPGYPQQYRSFYLDHAAGVRMLHSAGGAVDWLVVSPAGDFHQDGARTGRYRAATADPASRVSYADLAVALIDEIDAPAHHRTHLGVEAA